MRGPIRRLDNEAQLGLDFLVGFTIFMLGFIFVALLMSGLLINLQSKTIDYDAVAYRTGTILLEDPGQPQDWQNLDIRPQSNRDKIKRLGLSVDRGFPGILDYSKVQKFFLSTTDVSCKGSNVFCNPDDYRDKLIFGDYPYQFNITITSIVTNDYNNSIGSPYPNNYGYIKRIAKVKQPSYLIIPVNTSGTRNNITLQIDFGELYTRSSEYNIDPLTESITVSLTNFGGITRTLTQIRICDIPSLGNPTCYSLIPNSPTIKIMSDDDGIWRNPPPPQISVSNSLNITTEIGFFQRYGFDQASKVNLVLFFNDKITNISEYVYDYENATIPPLVPAVVEVRVW